MQFDNIGLTQSKLNIKRLWSILGVVWSPCFLCQCQVWSG